MAIVKIVDLIETDKMVKTDNKETDLHQEAMATLLAETETSTVAKMVDNLGTEMVKTDQME